MGAQRSPGSTQHAHMEEMVCPSYNTSVANATLRAMTMCIAISCACVTCCSSMAGSTYAGMQEEFNVVEEVCILSISLFVMGLGVGPRE